MGIDFKLHVKVAAAHDLADQSEVSCACSGYDSIVLKAQRISLVELICVARVEIGVTIDGTCQLSLIAGIQYVFLFSNRDGCPDLSLAVRHGWLDGDAHGRVDLDVCVSGSCRTLGVTLWNDQSRHLDHVHVYARWYRAFSQQPDWTGVIWMDRRRQDWLVAVLVGLFSVRRNGGCPDTIVDDFF